MSAYNIVADIASICPHCRAEVSVGVQFKFGAIWQYRYVVGDVLRWGGNDVGVPGRPTVVADGSADSDCVVCGYNGDWNFYVFIERDRIVRVTEADGTYDFARVENACLTLGDASGDSGC